MLKKLLTDFRFWIILFFLIRLIGITNAPLEISHNWRQSLTNMIARNFLVDGVDLLHPKIDMAGEKSGIIGAEFPFFNYLIYLFAELFGYQHWYGRLINLCFSSIGTYYFYRLIKALFNKRLALHAGIILLSSIWFSFSRKIMPDTFSVSLMITALWFSYQYLKNGNFLHLLLFFLLSCLSGLSKIPAISLLSLLVVTLFVPQICTKRKIFLYISAAISFSIIGLWYFYWVPHLVNTYGYQLFFPKTFLEGFIEIKAYLPELAEKFYYNSLKSYVAFIAFVIGLFFFVKEKKRLQTIGFISMLITFCLFILKTGSVFPLHSYYIIPFTPIMAFIVAKFTSKIPYKPAWIIISLIVIEAIASQQHDFFIKADKEYKIQSERMSDQWIPKTDKVIVNGGASPQSIYFINRKGWTLKNNNINPKTIDSLQQLGANYLVIDKNYGQLNFKVDSLAFENDNFQLYQLK